MRQYINDEKVPYDKSTQELIAMLDVPSLFHVACEALSYKSDELSLTTLMAIIEDDDPFKRRIGVECLGNNAKFDKVLDHLIICLDDKSPYVVRISIEMMVKHHVIKSHEKIILLLQSKDELTREAAVSALEYISKPSDFDVVLKLLSDRNKKVRNRVPYILLATANESNWRKAYNVMKHSENDKSRLYACYLLNAFGTKEERDDAKTFLYDKNGHIRKFASKMSNENSTL